jgi:hypothetical protein
VVFVAAHESTGGGLRSTFELHPRFKRIVSRIKSFAVSCTGIRGSVDYLILRLKFIARRQVSYCERRLYKGL